jgi:hypothetical protein
VKSQIRQVKEASPIQDTEFRMQHLACLIATNTQQSMSCWGLHPGAPIARQADVRVLLDQEGIAL